MIMNRGVMTALTGIPVIIWTGRDIFKVPRGLTELSNDVRMRSKQDFCVAFAPRESSILLLDIVQQPNCGDVCLCWKTAISFSQQNWTRWQTWRESVLVKVFITPALEVVGGLREYLP